LTGNGRRKPRDKNRGLGNDEQEEERKERTMKKEEKREKKERKSV
jgi:hypothetical protein